VVSVRDPYGRILGFLDRSLYFSIKQLLSCTHEAEWTPFRPTTFFSGSAGNRHVRWNPCPHSMARPRVADGGTASRYEG
jgi:hypothetical protein